MGRSAQLRGPEVPILSGSENSAAHAAAVRIQGNSAGEEEAQLPRQSATNHELSRVALLAGLPGEVLADLGKNMERQEIAPGAVIVREGEPGDRFYVLFAGMLSVSNSAMGQ